MAVVRLGQMFLESESHFGINSSGAPTHFVPEVLCQHSLPEEKKNSFRAGALQEAEITFQILIGIGGT